MSYQVLARKWRPRRFSELIGQEHVVRALTNALSSGRLHHAYLFTGTRGVGKTTVARVFAKALNCESGVTAEPCGQCSSCVEVDEGRFIDLIEVDAASRARVDETRELMDNVQYAPARGRYKVYLIDEVHMFSAHSFNALLKTLEEPPPHVKFLLATTDPQKMPVTVLSRCLQFHLRQLPASEIVRHLTVLTGVEAVQAEPAGLALIGRAAAGSMRDSLSLLDQAIAHGDGAVLEVDVRAMLGVTRQDAVHDIVDRLADGQASEVLALMDVLAGESVDFSDLLGELVGVLQRMAVAKLVPERDADALDAARVQALAERFTAEDIQLLYQIGILGRRDLPFALDARNGVEMTLLRMLAFQPDTGPGDGGASRSQASAASAALGAGTSASAASTASGPPEARHQYAPPARLNGSVALGVEPKAPESQHRPDATEASGPLIPAVVATAAPAPRPESHPQIAVSAQAVLDTEAVSSHPADGVEGAGSPAEYSALTHEPTPDMALAEGSVLELMPSTWRRIIEMLGIRGLAKELSFNTQMVAERDGVLDLCIAPKYAQLRLARAEQTLAEALSEYLGRTIKLRIEVGELDQETPQQAVVREANTAHAQATAAIREDPTVQAICDMFDATVDPDEIQARPS